MGHPTGRSTKACPGVGRGPQHPAHPTLPRPQGTGSSCFEDWKWRWRTDWTKRWPGENHACTPLLPDLGASSAPPIRTPAPGAGAVWGGVVGCSAEGNLCGLTGGGTTPAQPAPPPPRPGVLHGLGVVACCFLPGTEFPSAYEVRTDHGKHLITRLNILEEEEAKARFRVPWAGTQENSGQRCVSGGQRERPGGRGGQGSPGWGAAGGREGAPGQGMPSRLRSPALPTCPRPVIKVSQVLQIGGERPPHS